MTRRFGVVSVVLASLAASPALGQTATDSGGTLSSGVAEAGRAWSGLVDTAARAFDSATGWWQPPEPSDALPDRLPEEDQAFIALMDVAGYRVVGIEVDGGLLPDGDTYHFLQERLPSAADLERVRTGLAGHRDRFSGPTAMRHRRILGAILDMAPRGDYRISSIDIGRGWWPEVRFHVTAADRPLTDSERRLLDAARGTAPAGP